MDVVPFYAFFAFVAMVVLAIVNSRIKVDLARPTDVAVWTEGLPLYFAHSHRDLVDYGLIHSNQAWLDRLHASFGEGDELYQAGEDLRHMSRPGRSLLTAATCCVTFAPGWKAEEVGPALAAALRERGVEMEFRLDEIQMLEEGGFHGALTVGPWTRELDFDLPGDIYREANAILEADGWRIVQFATGNIVHAFAPMPLPLARKIHQSELWDLIDPPGGEELQEGGTPEQWYTWLY